MAGVLAAARITHHAPRLAHFEKIFMLCSGQFDNGVSLTRAQGAGQWQTPHCGIDSTTGPNRAGLSAALRERSFDKDSC
jgi:hypothetical protein